MLTPPFINNNKKIIIGLNVSGLMKFGVKTIFEASNMRNVTKSDTKSLDVCGYLHQYQNGQKPVNQK